MPREMLDETWLRARYFDDEMTLAQIGALLGRSEASLKVAFRRFGIPTRNARIRRLAHVEDEVAARYVDGESLATLARAYSVSLNTIVKLLEARGIARRPPSVTSRSTPRRSKAHDALRVPGFLHAEYELGGKSISVIAGQLGCTTKTVRAAMRELGIEVRRGQHNARPTGVRTLSHRQLLQIRQEFDGCAICGRHDEPEVHHRDSDRANNAPENLIVLCMPHHRMVEWFIKPVERRLRQPAEVA